MIRYCIFMNYEPLSSKLKQKGFVLNDYMKMELSEINYEKNPFWWYSNFKRYTSKICHLVFPLQICTTLWVCEKKWGQSLQSQMGSFWLYWHLTERVQFSAPIPHINTRYNNVLIWNYAIWDMFTMLNLKATQPVIL